MAQWDGSIYRRGLTLSLEAGLEQEPLLTFRPLVLLSTEEFLELGNAPFATLIAENGDSLNYGFRNRTDFRSRADEHSQRYNLQLRLEKKLISGLEFGGGLFLSAGDYSTRLMKPLTELEDFAYGVSKVDYLKAGLTGSLKFHLFRTRRLQPYAGIQALFLYEQNRRSHRRIIFPAQGRELAVNDDGYLGPESFFVLDMRLLIGLDYPLTNRIHLGLNFAPIGAATQQYAGVQVKYLTSRY